MGFISEWIESIKQDIQYRKEKKNVYKQIRREAQLEALQSLKPELAEQMRQKELDKLSGKKKKEFYEKFAKNMDNFTTKVSNNVKEMYGPNSSQDRLSPNTNQKDNKKKNLVERNSLDYKDKLNQMLGK